MAAAESFPCPMVAVTKAARTERIVMCQFRLADIQDFDLVKVILNQCGLSDRIEHGDRTPCWLAFDKAELVGCAALEIGQSAGLVRSVAVLPAYRGRGLARQLMQRLIADASARHIGRLYLFSKDSAGFFCRLGWQSVSVRHVADALPDAPQVRYYEEVGWYPDEKAFGMHL